MNQPIYEPSTKLQSFLKTQGISAATTRASVMKVLFASTEPLSRFEIHQRTGLRLSTVCGAVSVLLKKGFVHQAGIKLDLESNRNVELIAVVPSEFAA